MKMRKIWLPFIMIAAVLIGSMGNINRVDARKTYRMTVGGKLYLKINTSKRISWSSSNKRVATVTKHGGVVKAKRAGKTTICGKYGKKRAYAKIIVRKKQVSPGPETKPEPEETPKPTMSPSPSPTPKVKTPEEIAENIKVEAKRLSSGRILFTVKNQNPEYVYGVDVTLSLYNSAGAFLKDYVIYAQFLKKDGGEYYEVVQPDSVFERMDISKIVVSKKQVEQNEKSMYIGDGVEGNIHLGSGSDKKVYVTLKNNTVTTAHCRFAVLYLDDAQNIVDAVQGHAKIEPGETFESSYNKANNYYSEDYISFSSSVLKWTASDTV